MSHITAEAQCLKYLNKQRKTEAEFGGSSIQCWDQSDNRRPQTETNRK